MSAGDLEVRELSAVQALQRARALAARPGSTILGITGPPGAGKSTLAGSVVAHVEGSVLVGMDAFHLAHSALERLALVGVKGAPHTFDVAGYVALLRRIRATEGGVVWAPEFRREVEDAVAGAVAVPPGAPLVVTEGNYLLLDDGPWAQVRGLLDEVWYAAVPDDVRRARLVARHERYGRDPGRARERTFGSDEANARAVAATRGRADLVVRCD